VCLPWIDRDRGPEQSSLAAERVMNGQSLGFFLRSDKEGDRSRAGSGNLSFQNQGSS
jgi:hypothetical protein